MEFDEAHVISRPQNEAIESLGHRPIYTEAGESGVVSAELAETYLPKALTREEFEVIVEGPPRVTSQFQGWPG